MYAVAIDGPAGAGKSTIARRVAAQLGLIYVDTGALYRAIGLYALEQGADPREQAQVEPLLSQLNLELCFSQEQGQRVLLNGRDVSEAIRQPEVSMAASQVSALPPVRAYLLEQQRDLARKQNVIMDGRDIGTVVLPQAQVKIFLSANPRERALRRWKEYKEKGQNLDFETVLADVERRDRQDQERAIAPLRPAEDAQLLDSSKLSFEETVEAVLAIIKERVG